MSAPYDTEPLPYDDVRPCMVCLRADCPGHRPITDGDILAAATDGVAPYELCWRAFGPPGEERDIARAEIAKLISKETRS